MAGTDTFTSTWGLQRVGDAFVALLGAREGISVGRFHGCLAAGLTSSLAAISQSDPMRVSRLLAIVLSYGYDL